MGIEVSVSEFKAKCLEYFDKLSRNEIDSISVTKRGKPIGVFTPTRPTREEVLAEMREWQARMKGKLVILDAEFDLTKPIVNIDDIDALHGRVFPGDE